MTLTKARKSRATEIDILDKEMFKNQYPEIYAACLNKNTITRKLYINQ